MLARRILAFGFLVLASLGAAACGGGDGGAVTGPGPENPAPPPTPSAGKGTLVVTNVSNDFAVYIRTRACGTAAWSDDLLSYPNAAGATMHPGESASWEFDPGCYDVYFRPGHAVNGEQVVSDVQIQAGKSVTVTISSWPSNQ